MTAESAAGPAQDTPPGQQLAPENIYATAIVVGNHGILIAGPSGSGKTTLALALIEHFSRRGRFSRLVGDDRLYAACRDGRLICRVPPAIAGLVEVPGLGPQPVSFEPGAVIDLAIRLVAPEAMPRFQEESRWTVSGCSLAEMILAARNVTAALPAVVARLNRLRLKPD